jgi:hypothetical protein
MKPKGFGSPEKPKIPATAAPTLVGSYQRIDEKETPRWPKAKE